MRAKRILLAALSAVAVFAAPLQTFAQTVPSAPQAEKKPAPSGVKSYEAGAKAFEAGKYAPAIQSLSTALSMGGLSSQQMAKALYYRGAAYRKTGKSAQAISDLTSAVWLKNGLSDADRTAATEQRQSAYQEAGLGTASPAGTPPLDAPPKPADTAASAQPAAVVSPPTSPVAAATPANSATSSWAATSEKNAAEASVPDLSTPAGGYATLSSPDAPSLGALPQGETGSAAAAAPGGGVGSAISSAGSAVTGFFGGMFGGGGSDANANPPAEVATAAVPAAPPQPPPPAAGWDSGTSVVSAPPKPEKPTTKKKIAAADPARATAAGKYRLQVGIVRSREEAEQITSKLRAEHAEAFGTAVPAIEEVTFGSGTFYRVQVGPYASAAEPGQFCTALKPQGYDCLVVTK